jgi:hypothetical protein
MTHDSMQPKNDRSDHERRADANRRQPPPRRRAECAIEGTHPDRRLGTDRRQMVWDPATGQLLHTLTGNTDPVSSATLSPDGRTLASGSDDITVRLWIAGATR